jgi:hypothetical protein
MTDVESERIYLCPSCLTPADSGGPCRNCGETVIECKPGDPDDPCRRPLIDDQGRVRTRAPLWWVRQLTDYLEVARDAGTKNE